jgi:hypothetical protein
LSPCPERRRVGVQPPPEQKPFVQKKGIAYPILKGNEQVLLGLEGFSGMPTTLIVDQKGNIKKKYDGSFDEVDLEKNLKELLR